MFLVNLPMRFVKKVYARIDRISKINKNGIHFQKHLYQVISKLITGEIVIDSPKRKPVQGAAPPDTG